MNNLVPNESTFWRFSIGDQYYCDWRLTVTHCEGDIIFHYLGIINIVLTALIVIIGYGLLYHRLVVLKQVIFEYKNNFLRPRAMESVVFFMSIFNTVRLIQSVIIITDTVQNIIFRQFIFEFGYELGFTTLTTYLYGVTHALRESDRAIFDQWISSPKYVDIFCTLAIIAPFFTNTISSFGAGISAYYGNYDLANTFVQVLYTVWIVHCIVIATATLVSGLRLVNILEAHIKRKEEAQAAIDVSKVQLGAQKVKIIAFTSSICLYLYTGVSLTYATIRYKIHTHIVWNLIFCISWNGLGIVASILVSFAVILNPKMKFTLLFSYGSSGAQKSEGGGYSSRFASSKNKKSENTTGFGGSTTVGSMCDTHTFEHGSDFINFESKRLDQLNQNDINNKSNNNMYTSMDVAPTLSTAVAMKLCSTNHQNPLVMDDHDVELVHAYPESTKSSTQLVVDEKYHY